MTHDFTSPGPQNFEGNMQGWPCVRAPRNHHAGKASSVPPLLLLLFFLQTFAIVQYLNKKIYIRTISHIYMK